MPFLRLLRDWRRYKRGRVIEPAGGVAEILIRRGIGELVKPTADDTSPHDAPKKRRRKSGDSNS